MNEFMMDPNVILNDYLIPWGTRIVLAVAIFFVGKWVARALTRTIGGLLAKGGLDEMLVRFLSNIAFTALMAVVVIAALEQLGVDTTGALAVLGAAGLAVGLALKDSLSNFAAGVMLIVFRPFTTGNFVEVAGTSGIVESVKVFNTVLRTPDNREVTIPNGQIYGSVIVNVSARDTRRIDLVFGIGYDDDLRKAKALLEELMAADERILKDPEPMVAVLELADSSVNLAVRPWVASSDFWATRCDLIENTKLRFDQEGVSIPYPQRDVHLHPSERTA